MENVTLNAADAKKLRDGINEMCGCLQKMEDQKEAMGDIADALSKLTGIKKPILNKVAKAVHSSKFEQISHDNDHFEYVYEAVMLERSED